MKKIINKSYSFLTIGKTQDSAEVSEVGFKRYVGVASTKVLAVCPDKKTTDELMGFETANAPEYVSEDGNEVRITFIVRTDADANNGIEITNFLSFTLRNDKRFSNDKSKLVVIDSYGNSCWAPAEDAQQHKALPSNYKIDQTGYRIARDGEADLVAFLKAYLVVPGSLKYNNGVWSVAEDAQNSKFQLDHIDDYFKGDFSEIREAIALRPTNKVKLLYGVKTKEDGKLRQVIATKGELILRNSINTYDRLEKDLIDTKQAGLYSNVEFKVQALKEYTVEATNLEKPADTSNEMPW